MMMDGERGGEEEGRARRRGGGGGGPIKSKDKLCLSGVWQVRRKEDR